MPAQDHYQPYKRWCPTCKTQCIHKWGDGKRPGGTCNHKDTSVLPLAIRNAVDYETLPENDVERTSGKFTSNGMDRFESGKRTGSILYSVAETKVYIMEPLKYSSVDGKTKNTYRNIISFSSPRFVEKSTLHRPGWAYRNTETRHNCVLTRFRPHIAYIAQHCLEVFFCIASNVKLRTYNYFTIHYIKDSDNFCKNRLQRFLYSVYKIFLIL